MKSLKYWFLFPLIVGAYLLMTHQTADDDFLTLILNSENIEGKLPRNFRTSRDPWLRSMTGKEPSRVGLETLNVSGSGQFSENGLQEILSHLNTSQLIIVVDLRQESHGFINGVAVSWFAPHDAANVGKTLPEIEKDETNRLQELLNKKVTVQHVIAKPEDIITKTTPIFLDVVLTATEHELTQLSKVGYFRIPVTDHLPPTTENVERFLSFVRSLPSNAWLHFHCEAGDGRTTTFLCLYDMLRNGKEVSLEDIIERQYLLGGINLLQMPDQKSWKYSHAVDRKHFLENFYTKTNRTNE